MSRGIQIQFGRCGLADSFTIGKHASLRPAAQHSDGERRQLHCHGLCNAAGPALLGGRPKQFTCQRQRPLRDHRDYGTNPLSVTPATRGVNLINFKRINACKFVKTKIWR